MRYRRALHLVESSKTTYESLVSRLDSGVLKRVARHWAGKEASKMNKDACIGAIARGLADPEATRAMVEQLSELERAALCLVKLRDNSVSSPEIAMELWVLGFYRANEKRSYYSSYGRDTKLYEALNKLLETGLLLLVDPDSEYSSYRSQISEYHFGWYVQSDERILAHVQPQAPLPLEIKPVLDVEQGFYRRPAEVMLRFISLVEALRKLGRIELTKKGRPAKPFMAKLVKTLGWEDTLATESYTPLRNATSFFFKLLEGAGVIDLVPETGEPRIAPNSDDYFRRPFEEQGGDWVGAYRSMSGWAECLFDSYSYWLRPEELEDGGKLNALRAGLLLGLAALPDPAGWYGVGDLSEAIFERAGERFSLEHLKGIHLTYGATREQADKEIQGWRGELRDNWHKFEEPWVAAAIQGPLFHLGMVELAFETGKKKQGPTLFRLTEIGRSAVYDVFRAKGPMVVVPPPSQAEQPCWLVQSNFEAIVHLERASAAQLALIERVSQRSSSTGSAAVYRLTRESIYQGLQSGLSLDTVLESLRAWSEHPLPDNVERTIQDWAARREQLSVHLLASVLEFANQAERDAALAAGRFEGVPIGEHFLRITGRVSTKKVLDHCSCVVDYSQPLPRCVSVLEDGVVKIDPVKADLLVRGQLAALAEADSDDCNRWRISRSSIQKAIGLGWNVERILEVVAQRTKEDIPPILSVAIRAWAGAASPPTSVALAKDIVLHAPSDEVAKAIWASEVLQPYFRARLGPKTFLVKRECAEALSAKLQEFGLVVGNDLGTFATGQNAIV